VLVIPDPAHETWLTARLAQESDCSLAAVVGSLDEACRHVPVNVLLVDLAVPDAMDEARWAALRLCDPTAWLIVVFGDYGPALRHAATAGARAFLPKSLSDETLWSALKMALRGERVIPDEQFFTRLWGTQAQSENGAPQQASLAPERLTPRERDILGLLADGLSNKEIATRLGLKEKTIKNRVSEILSKLGLRNRTQAAIWAREHGLGGKP
jgi:DNA-binding NarL/FixJ family response regulator